MKEISKSRCEEREREGKRRERLQRLIYVADS
jgi:hypothetical protein